MKTSKCSRIHILMMMVALSTIAVLSRAVHVEGAILLVDQEVIQGGGFGNELNILTLSDDAKDFGQWGSVLWNGSEDSYVNKKSGNSGDVDTTGSGTKTATHSIQELKDAGITKDMFGLLLDINEGDANKEIRLRDFSLLFFESDGTLNFALTYDAADGGELFQNTGGGAGSSDWLFQIQFENASQASFFDNNASGRVGMEVSLGALPFLGAKS